MSDPVVAVEKALRSPNELFKLIGSETVAAGHVFKAIDDAGWEVLPKEGPLADQDLADQDQEFPARRMSSASRVLLWTAAAALIVFTAFSLATMLLLIAAPKHLATVEPMIATSALGLAALSGLAAWVLPRARRS